MRKKTSITVNIDISCDIVRFNRRKMVEMARETAEKFGIKKAQVNLFIAGDKEIIKINRKFLKTKKLTDCISFDLSEKKDNFKFFDIIVNAQLAHRQAKPRGHSSESELALYVLHGLLHNLGFDDSTSAKAARMHKTEDQILKKFGYGVVYNRKNKSNR